MKSLNILIFLPAELYDGAESLVTLKFAKLLRNNGNNVVVIYRKNKKNAVLEDPVKIRECSRGVTSTLPGRFGSIEWCIRAFLYAWKMHKKSKFNIIISRIMPVYGHLPGLFLHFFTRIPWLANWSDPYPQKTAPAPYGEGPDVKIPFLQKLFCNVLINSANYHSFPSERLRQLFIYVFPHLKEKSFVIPHVMFDCFEQTQMVDHPTLEIVYAGSGFEQRHPEIVVEAVEKVQKAIGHDLNLHVSFYGELYPPLQKKIEASPCKAIFTVAGKVSYSQALHYIQNSDLTLMLEAPCDNGVFLSSKLLEYLQCGKPVLALSPAKGVMSDLIHEFGGGVFANCASPEDSAQKIQEVYTDWMSCKLRSIKYDISCLKGYFSEKNVMKQWNVIASSLEDRR